MYDNLINRNIIFFILAKEHFFVCYISFKHGNSEKSTSSTCTIWYNLFNTQTRNIINHL